MTTAHPRARLDELIHQPVRFSLLAGLGHVGKWPRTWLKLTPQGRTAFENHMATLREIAGG